MQELIVTILLILLLGAFVSPLGLLMPESSDMIVLSLFAVSVLVYLAVIWKEYARDEREHTHRLAAGRISFFAGTSIITLGIITQALKHNIDPWLVFAFGAMLLTKIIVRFYNQTKH